MPKSYELKLRNAEEDRRPQEDYPVYMPKEGVTQKILLGYDHPETLKLEMQTMWVDDTLTIDEVHDTVMAEVRRLDQEHGRGPLKCDYSKKYVWYDRFYMRPRAHGRELTLQDYDFRSGYRLKITPFYMAEQMWGQPEPCDPPRQRKPEDMAPGVDKKLLRRLNEGPPNPRVRIFCWLWMGGKAEAYIPFAKAMPRDYGVYVLELPVRGEREDDENYPNSQFMIEVMAHTLRQEMKKPGSNFFFGLSQGTHYAYYVAKYMQDQFNMRPKCLFVSNFFVPAALPVMDMSTLRNRQKWCVPLQIFCSLVKGGWGTNPMLAHKNHMGLTSYQTRELWSSAKMILADHFIKGDLPLPGADEPLQGTPIMAFHGKDDPAVSAEMTEEWKGLSGDPKTFQLKMMPGEHLWFTNSETNADKLGKEMTAMIKRLL